MFFLHPKPTVIIKLLNVDGLYKRAVKYGGFCFFLFGFVSITSQVALCWYFQNDY